MEDKTQYEIFREEFLKATDALRDAITDFGERLSKLLPDIEIPDEEEEDTWEMKCPYEDGDEFCFIDNYGNVHHHNWKKNKWIDINFNQGHIFPTKEAAELESKRRNLLTRFRAFRDECNDGWKPDWKDGFEDKLFISFDIFGDKLSWRLARSVNGFNTFGYFQNESDALKAIELFGDEIKELFVDERLVSE